MVLLRGTGGNGRVTGLTAIVDVPASVGGVAIVVDVLQGGTIITGLIRDRHGPGESSWILSSRLTSICVLQTVLRSNTVVSVDTSQRVSCDRTVITIGKIRLSACNGSGNCQGSQELHDKVLIIKVSS